MKCIQCLDALVEMTSANGSSASCSRCSIEHLSLGRLIRLSDSFLMTKIWSLIEDDSAREDWKTLGTCPYCERGLTGVPFRSGGEEHALIVCFKCYLITMKPPTLTLFKESNLAFKSKQLAERRMQNEVRRQNELHHDKELLKELARQGLDRIIEVINHPKFGPVKITLLVTLGTSITTVFTSLLPYSSMELFDGGTHSVILASFTHVTFFQFAWNLLFFIYLSPECEKQEGSTKYALLMGFILSVAIPLGKWISPYGSLPIIGLSPWVAALIGRKMANRSMIHFNLSPKLGLERLHYAFHPTSVAFIFTLSELRTIIPTGGGLRWFNLTACACAAILSAAFTCWRKTTLKKQQRSAYAAPVIPIRAVTTRSSNSAVTTKKAA